MSWQICRYEVFGLRTLVGYPIQSPKTTITEAFTHFQRNVTMENNSFIPFQPSLNSFSVIRGSVREHFPLPTPLLSLAHAKNLDGYLVFDDFRCFISAKKKCPTNEWEVQRSCQLREVRTLTSVESLAAWTGGLWSHQAIFSLQTEINCVRSAKNVCAGV